MSWWRCVNARLVGARLDAQPSSFSVVIQRVRMRFISARHSGDAKSVLGESPQTERYDALQSGSHPHPQSPTGFGESSGGLTRWPRCGDHQNHRAGESAGSAVSPCARMSASACFTDGEPVQKYAAFQNEVTLMLRLCARSMKVIHSASPPILVLILL